MYTVVLGHLTTCLVGAYKSPKSIPLEPEAVTYEFDTGITNRYSLKTYYNYYAHKQKWIIFP